MTDKEKILKIAQDLENEIIDEKKARQLLLHALGVTGTAQPLTIKQVIKLMDGTSLDAFIACGKTKLDWRRWMQERGKVNLNTPNEDSHNDDQPKTETEPPSFDDAPEWAKFLTVNNLGTWVWHETQPKRISMKGDINMWTSTGQSQIARLDFRTPKVYEK